MNTNRLVAGSVSLIIGIALSLLGMTRYEFAVLNGSTSIFPALFFLILGAILIVKSLIRR